MQGVSVVLLMMLEVIAVVWVYGLRRLTRDIHFMLGRSTGLYWKVCWGVFNPVFLVIVFVYSQVQSQELTYGTYVFDKISSGKNAIESGPNHFYSMSKYDMSTSSS